MDDFHQVSDVVVVAPPPAAPSSKSSSKTDSIDSRSGRSKKSSSSSSSKKPKGILKNSNPNASYHHQSSHHQDQFEGDSLEVNTSSQASNGTHSSSNASNGTSTSSRHKSHRHRHGHKNGNHDHSVERDEHRDKDHHRDKDYHRDRDYHNQRDNSESMERESSSRHHKSSSSRKHRHHHSSRESLNSENDAAFEHHNGKSRASNNNTSERSRGSNNTSERSHHRNSSSRNSDHELANTSEMISENENNYNTKSSSRSKKSKSKDKKHSSSSSSKHSSSQHSSNNTSSVENNQIHTQQQVAEMNLNGGDMPLHNNKNKNSAALNNDMNNIYDMPKIPALPLSASNSTTNASSSADWLDANSGNSSSILKNLGNGSSHLNSIIEADSLNSNPNLLEIEQYPGFYENLNFKNRNANNSGHVDNNIDNNGFIEPIYNNTIDNNTPTYFDNTSSTTNIIDDKLQALYDVPRSAKRVLQVESDLSKNTTNQISTSEAIEEAIYVNNGYDNPIVEKDYDVPRLSQQSLKDFIPQDYDVPKIRDSLSTIEEEHQEYDVPRSSQALIDTSTSDRGSSEDNLYENQGYAIPKGHNIISENIYANEEAGKYCDYGGSQGGDSDRSSGYRSSSSPSIQSEELYVNESVIASLEDLHSTSSGVYSQKHSSPEPGSSPPHVRDVAIETTVTLERNSEKEKDKEKRRKKQELKEARRRRELEAELQAKELEREREKEREKAAEIEREILRRREEEKKKKEAKQLAKKENTSSVSSLKKKKSQAPAPPPPPPLPENNSGNSSVVKKESKKKEEKKEKVSSSNVSSKSYSSDTYEKKKSSTLPLKSAQNSEKSNKSSKVNGSQTLTKEASSSAKSNGEISFSTDTFTKSEKKGIQKDRSVDVYNETVRQRASRNDVTSKSVFTENENNLNNGTLKTSTSEIFLSQPEEKSTSHQKKEEKKRSRSREKNLSKEATFVIEEKASSVQKQEVNSTLSKRTSQHTYVSQETISINKSEKKSSVSKASSKKLIDDSFNSKPSSKKLIEDTFNPKSSSHQLIEENFNSKSSSKKLIEDNFNSKLIEENFNSKAVTNGHDLAYEQNEKLISKSSIVNGKGSVRLSSSSTSSSAKNNTNNQHQHLNTYGNTVNGVTNYTNGGSNVSGGTSSSSGKSTVNGGTNSSSGSSVNGGTSSNSGGSTVNGGTTSSRKKKRAPKQPEYKDDDDMPSVQQLRSKFEVGKDDFMYGKKGFHVMASLTRRGAMALSKSMMQVKDIDFDAMEQTSTSSSPIANSSASSVEKNNRNHHYNKNRSSSMDELAVPSNIREEIKMETNYQQQQQMVGKSRLGSSSKNGATEFETNHKTTSSVPEMKSVTTTDSSLEQDADPRLMLNPLDKAGKKFSSSSESKSSGTVVQRKEWNPTGLVAQMYQLPSVEDNENEKHDATHIEGYVERLPVGKKKSTIWNSWKKHYMIAKGGVLSVFADKNCTSVLDKMELFGGRIEFLDANMLGVQDRRGLYLSLKFPTQDLTKEWEEALTTNCRQDFSRSFVTPSPIPKLQTLFTNVIVVDIGGSSVRAGIAAYQLPTLPQIFFPSVMAVAHNSDDEKYFGMDAFAPEVRAHCNLYHPMVPSKTIDKYSVDQIALQGIFEKIFKELSVEPHDYEIQVSVPRVFSDKTKQAIAGILFEEFGVQSVNMAHQTVFAMYAYDAKSGIVVDVGERMDIVPIVDGYKVNAGISRSPVGGAELRAKLQHFLLGRNYSLTSFVDSFITRFSIEELTYMSKNFDQELEKYARTPEKIDAKIDVSAKDCLGSPVTSIELGSERFEACEGLFKPELWGLDQAGIHVLVHKAIKECSMDVRKEVTQSIFLSGGLTLIPGFRGRLEIELEKLTPVKPKVHASPYRYHAAYLGACVHANSSAYQHTKVTRDEWMQAGSRVTRNWTL